MNIAAYATKYFALPTLRRMGWDIVYLLAMMGMLIFVSELRSTLTIYAMLLVLAETYRAKHKELNTPFLNGLVMSIVTVLVAVTIFVALKGLELREAPASFTVSIFALIIYYMCTTSIEVDIFRVILPQYIGKLLSNIAYTIFHAAVILTLVAGATGFTLATISDPKFIYALIFTFIFGFLEQLLVDSFKSTTPAKNAHWVFDLFKTGLIFQIIALRGVTT